MYYIWGESQSEIEWYGKMVEFLKKHDMYGTSDLWDSALSYIYCEFCYIIGDESSPSMHELFDASGLDINACIRNEGIGISLNMIESYMLQYDLSEVTLSAFNDMLEYFEDDLYNILYDRILKLVSEFWVILDMECKSTYEKILFFYVREEHYNSTLKWHNPSASLDFLIEESDYIDEEYVLSEEEDEEDEADVEMDTNSTKKIIEYRKEKLKTVLYSFVNNYRATESAMRVYEWIENSTDNSSRRESIKLLKSKAVPVQIKWYNYEVPENVLPEIRIVKQIQSYVEEFYFDSDFNITDLEDDIEVIAFPLMVVPRNISICEIIHHLHGSDVETFCEEQVVSYMTMVLQKLDMMTNNKYVFQELFEKYCSSIGWEVSDLLALNDPNKKLMLTYQILADISINENLL